MNEEDGSLGPRNGRGLSLYLPLSSQDVRPLINMIQCQISARISWNDHVRTVFVGEANSRIEAVQRSTWFWCAGLTLE